MNELIALIKESPDSIKWAGYLLAYLLGATFLVDKVFNVYNKSSAGLHAKKEDEFDKLKELVDGDDDLEAINYENRKHEAFLRLMKLSVSKEKRDYLSSIFRMNFLTAKQLRAIAPHIKYDNGRYVVSVGLSEFFGALWGMIGIVAIGIFMMVINFLTTKDDGIVRLVTLLTGGVFIFLAAFLTRGDAIAIRLALYVSKQLDERGLLEGEPGLKPLFMRAWRGGKKSFVIFCMISALVLFVAKVVSILV